MGHHEGTKDYVRVLSELVHTAECGGLVTFQHLALLMGLALVGPNMGHTVGLVLDDIDEAELAAGRPILSAVVVKNTGIAGPGFFTLARKHNRIPDGVTDMAFWKTERDAVYVAWRRPLRPVRCPS